MRIFFLLSIFLLSFFGKAISQNKKGRKAKHPQTIKKIDSVDYDLLWCRRVETDAKFGDDSTAWDKYLQQNVNTAVPKMNGAPVGTYIIIIHFIVGKDGVVNETIPLTQSGYGMEDEVIRIIKKSPKWLPATQNGRLVHYHRRQSFTFVVLEPLITGIIHASYNG